LLAAAAFLWRRRGAEADIDFDVDVAVPVWVTLVAGVVLAALVAWIVQRARARGAQLELGEAYARHIYDVL
jgi:hypothetical protein